MQSKEQFTWFLKKHVPSLAKSYCFSENFKEYMGPTSYTDNGT